MTGNEPIDSASESRTEESVEERLAELERENRSLQNRLNELESSGTEDDSDSEQDVAPVPDASPAPAGQETAGSSTPKLYRRGILATLASVGLLGAATQSASAATGLEFGGSYSGSANPGLEIKVTGKDQWAVRGVASETSGSSIGVRGRTSASNGSAIFGYASHPSGRTFGLRGTVDSPNGIGLYGKAVNENGGKGVRGAAKSTDGYGVYAENNATSGNPVALYGETQSSNGYGLYTPDDAYIEGDLEVKGTKNFVQAVKTSAGPREVYYNAVESGTAHTEVSDTATMEDGHALIELPEHFGMVTSDGEPLTVQVTPHAEERVHPQVVETSTEWISVEDFGDGPQNYRFSYTVKGVREGFEDEAVVCEPSGHESE